MPEPVSSRTAGSARDLKESISAPTVWKEKKWFYSCVGRAVPVETHKAGDTYGGRK
nr:MAG TPA: hypothetical protein [Caudoviricetes sp.]